MSFPMAWATAMGLKAGDEVQWELLDRGKLPLVRVKTTPPAAKSEARK